MPSSDTSSTSSSSSDQSDTYEYRPAKEQHRVARKSTASHTSNYTTRRQAALASIKQQQLQQPQQPQRLHNKNLRSVADRFLENFNPDTSTREKRKLIRKINPPSNIRRPPGALYDENGIHIATGIDVCDCLNQECPGCFFECEKCGSQKCGIDCRVHRKYMYDQIEYHGYDIVIKNPLMKH